MKQKANGRRFSLSATTLLLSLSLPLGLSAAANDIYSETDDSTIIASKSYKGSLDMPDGIAFYLVASILVDAEDSVGLQVSSSSEGSETTPVSLIVDFAEIDEAAARRLFEGIAPSARELLMESELEARKTACVPALSSWDSEKAAWVKNLMGDIREGVYEKHVIRAMIALDPEGQMNFQKLLHAMKLSSSYARTDNFKAYKDNPEGAKAFLLSLCDM